jgi:hypothetical protein
LLRDQTRFQLLKAYRRGLGPTGKPSVAAQGGERARVSGDNLPYACPEAA